MSGDNGDSGRDRAGSSSSSSNASVGDNGCGQSFGEPMAEATSSAAAHGQRVLVVFAHGMAGCAGDWATWLECLGALRPQWRLRALVSMEPHVKPIIGKGLDELAVLAAEEILEEVRQAEIEATDDADEPVTLHCVGHSMGGLVLRAAMPAVFREAPPTMRAGTFLTLATPHLGIQASWGAPESMWRNLSRVGRIWSNQLPQLAVQDTSSGTPFLVALSDPQGEYLPALDRFQRRACVTMAHGDFVIPTASGCIWADRAWPKPELDAGHPSRQRRRRGRGRGGGIMAGWGFEAMARNQALPRPSEVASVGSRELSWMTCQDGAVTFPRQILDGLQTTSWERLVVRLNIPGATTHVFLIGKRSDQSELEHCFSRACVGQLASMLAKSDELGDALEGIFPELPCWMRTLDVRESSRRECEGRWVVATEEGLGMVALYAFAEEVEANFYFDSMGATARILFDPKRQEMRYGGANLASFSTIRAVFERSPYEPSSEGRWTVATEEGSGNVQLYTYASASEAMSSFQTRSSSRILFNPLGVEMRCRGWNRLALSTIRRTFAREALPLGSLPMSPRLSPAISPSTSPATSPAATSAADGAIGGIMDLVAEGPPRSPMTRWEWDEPTVQTCLVGQM